MRRALGWIWARWWVWLCICPVAFDLGLRCFAWAIVQLYHGYVADLCSPSGRHCGNERPALEIALVLLGLLLLAVSFAALLRTVWLLGRSARRRLRRSESPPEG